VHILINLVAFKIAWLSTVLGSGAGLPLLGPAVVLVAIAIHLRWAAEPGREFTLILLAGTIGLAWDSFMLAAGWIRYPNGIFVAGLAPYWIVALWMLFATTLNVTFRWLQPRPALAAALGAVFGPVSYIAGAAVGAVELLQPSTVTLALAGAWALLFPGLLWLARTLDGSRPAVVNSRL